MTNSTERTAWLLLLIQQPDGNMLKSVGGECFASGRVLQSCLPQGPAERPWKVWQGPRIYISRQTSNSASFGQGWRRAEALRQPCCLQGCKEGSPPAPNQQLLPQNQQLCHQPWHCPSSDPAFPSPQRGAGASSRPAPSQALPPQFLASEELSKEIRAGSSSKHNTNIWRSKTRLGKQSLSPLPLRALPEYRFASAQPKPTLPCRVIHWWLVHLNV